jgi:hypothetical protein
MSWSVADDHNWSSFTLHFSDGMSVQKLGDTLVMSPPGAKHYFLYEVVDISEGVARYEVCPAWEFEVE